MSSAAGPERTHRGNLDSRRSGLLGLGCWGLVALLLVLVPADWVTPPAWNLAGGLIFGLLIGGGNVLLLQMLLGRGTTPLHHGLAGWGLLWAGKLLLVALLVWETLSQLHVSPLTLAVGISLAVASLVFKTRRGLVRTPVPTESGGEEHGR